MPEESKGGRKTVVILLFSIPDKAESGSPFGLRKYRKII